METPQEPSNPAEHVIADFYRGLVTKGDVLERLASETVHIPMDGPPSAGEEGDGTEASSLCLPKPDGHPCLVLLTSFPMFAPLAEEFRPFSQVFANHALETVLVHCAPDHGFVINPWTPLEFSISPAQAAQFRQGR